MNHEAPTPKVGWYVSAYVFNPKNHDKERIRKWEAKNPIYNSLRILYRPVAVCYSVFKRMWREGLKKEKKWHRETG